MKKYGLDKFYTKKHVVKKLLKEIDIDKYKTIIEPSAGNGSFSSVINDCIAYDIYPSREGIIEQDFLLIDEFFEGPVLVIGNPPFGRNSSLAFAFIKKASTIADTIAFILPRSFKKRSMYDKVPLNFWLIKEIDLDENSFTYNEKDFNVPCVFIVYKKRDVLREKEIKLTPNTFTFVKKETANVSIRRVGVYAGMAYMNINKSEQSHYFVYVKNPESFVNFVNNFEWEHNNTVGPRSISKNELIKKIDKI